MNGRVFDPRIGRFLRADPIVQSPGIGSSYNRYSYTSNNPLSAIDPTGFEEDDSQDDEDEPIDEVISYGVRLRGNSGGGFFGQFWSPGGGWYNGFWGALGGSRSVVSLSRIDQNPNIVLVCVGQARILEGNPNTIGQPGGFTGTTVGIFLVRANSSAVIPRQFVPNATYAKAVLRPFIDRISGSTGGGQRFDGVTDIVGNEKVPNVRTVMRTKNPGKFILELVSGKDEGVASITLQVPHALGCPEGTSPK